MLKLLFGVKAMMDIASFPVGTFRSAYDGIGTSSSCLKVSTLLTGVIRWHRLDCGCLSKRTENG